VICVSVVWRSKVAVRLADGLLFEADRLFMSVYAGSEDPAYERVGRSGVSNVSFPQ
jgi:hypothetical protein